MFLCLILQAILVFSGEICKQLNVSTNIKKTKDDIISKGIPNKQWSRRSKNPIIVPAIQQLDYVYITIENPNLKIDNFVIDFDDHYFADSQIRLDSRQNGKATEYAIEIKYECKQYGGAMINYELEFNIPNCGDSQIYWKKLCGNPITTRDGFTIDMIYKNHQQQIISNGIVNNATYFDHDLDNYVFNIPKDVDQLKFLVYMINSNPNTEPIAEGFITDEQTLRSLPEVNISLPFVDTDENVAKSWFDGPLAAGGLVDSKEQELNLNFKCLKFGTSKIEMTIPFDYFKDISLVFVKDCTYGNKVQNVLKEQYDDGDSKTLILYFIFLIIIAGLIINLCFGRKKGLANIPFFHSIVSLILCITCTNNTFIGRFVKNKLGLNQDPFNTSDEPDETFSNSQKLFYGSI